MAKIAVTVEELSYGNAQIVLEQDGNRIHIERHNAVVITAEMLVMLGLFKTLVEAIQFLEDWSPAIKNYK